MPVDSKYKGNRTLKDAGQKPQNAEDKEYVEMIQQQTTFEAAAEGGDFRYSENYQNFDPEKKDYQDLEYTYPPFNPPPFDPWPPGPVFPKDPPPGGGEEEKVSFVINTQLCWCPNKEVTANVICAAGRIVNVRMSAADRNKATVSLLSNGNVKIKASASEKNNQGSLTIVLTIVRTRAATDNSLAVNMVVEQTYNVPRCKDCCQCADAAISYVALLMEINTAQNLGITNADPDSCTYTWAITAGSTTGTLEPAEDGLSALFTAPTSNSNCDEGPITITLYCNGNVADSIIITINHLSYPRSHNWWDNDWYCISNITCTENCIEDTLNPGNWWCSRTVLSDCYFCDGTTLAEAGGGCYGDGRSSNVPFPDCDSCYASIPTCEAIAAGISVTHNGITYTPLAIGATLDFRGSYQLTYGCCYTPC